MTEHGPDPHDTSCRGDGPILPGSTCIRCGQPVVCPAGFESCNRHGFCASRAWCETDDDCDPERPACAPFFGCSKCRNTGPAGDGFLSSFCPATEPFCVPDWEGNGLFCAPCTPANQTNSCPAGTWCTASTLLSSDLVGECKPADCTRDPSSAACLSCLWYSASSCLEDGGICAPKVAAYCACRGQRGYPCTGVVSLFALRNPLLTPCRVLFDDLQACVADCPVARATCNPMADAGQDGG